MQAWIDARKRHGLSHAEVQMARELGMNPQKLGKLDNHDQEPWKMPLRQFIQHRYYKRFGTDRPDVIQTIEEKVRLDAEKKAIRRATKLLRRQTEAAQSKKSDGSAQASNAPPSEDNFLPKPWSSKNLAKRRRGIWVQRAEKAEPLWTRSAAMIPALVATEKGTSGAVSPALWKVTVQPGSLWRIAVRRSPS